MLVAPLSLRTPTFSSSPYIITPPWCNPNTHSRKQTHELETYILANVKMHMRVCLNVRTKRILLRCFTSLGSIRTCHPVQYCTSDFFLAHYVILFTTICLSYKYIQSSFYKTILCELISNEKRDITIFQASERFFLFS